MPCLLGPQRNAAAKQSKFERVTADGGTFELYLRPFDKPQCHQSLDIRARGVNRAYHAFFAPLQCGKAIAIWLRFHASNCPSTRPVIM